MQSYNVYQYKHWVCNNSMAWCRIRMPASLLSFFPSYGVYSMYAKLGSYSRNGSWNLQMCPYVPVDLSNLCILAWSFWLCLYIMLTGCTSIPESIWDVLFGNVIPYIPLYMQEYFFPTYWYSFRCILPWPVFQPNINLYHRRLVLTERCAHNNLLWML